MSNTPLPSIISYPTFGGLALLARCVAEKVPPVIKRAEIGIGRLDIPYEEATELAEPLTNAHVGITSFVFNAGLPSANITVQVVSGTEGGFAYTELGLWAEDPDDPDREILINYTPRYDYPAAVYPGSISEITIVLAVSGVRELNVTVSPGSMLSISEGDGRYWKRDEVIPVYALERQREQDEELAILQERMELLRAEINNGLTSGTEFRITFWDLQGIQVNDGVWDAASGRMMA